MGVSLEGDDGKVVDHILTENKELFAWTSIDIPELALE